MAYVRMKTPDGKMGSVLDESVNKYLGLGWSFDDGSVQAPATVSNDIDGMVEQLERAKLDNIVSGLGKARDTSLSNLAAEETTIKPQYYKARNAVSAGNQLGRRTLAEELSRRMETNSGVADEANIRANMSLQGSIGDLQQQETAAFGDIARRKSDVNNAYESDVANVKAGLAATSLSERIAEMRRQDELSRQDARYAQEDARYADETAYGRGRDKVADSRYDSNLADKKLDDEKQNYADTILRFYDDFQAEINRVRNDGDPSNDWRIPMLETARQQKKQGMVAGEQAASDAEYDKAFEMWKTSGVADQYISDVLGVPLNARTANFNISSMQEQRLRDSQNNSGNSQYADYGDYYKRGLDMLDMTERVYEPIYEGDGIHRTKTGEREVSKRKYGNESIIDWINSLPIPNADKTRLARDLGV